MAAYHNKQAELRYRGVSKNRFKVQGSKFKVKPLAIIDT
jgi:hypothetical protein